MQNNTIGINYLKIDKLILDIYDYSEKIQKTLDQISNIVDKTKDFYLCYEADCYRNKFSDFRQNFPVINKNIISYAEDLIRLKTNYQRTAGDILSSMNTAIKKIETPQSKKWEIPGRINKL